MVTSGLPSRWASNVGGIHRWQMDSPGKGPVSISMSSWMFSSKIIIPSLKLNWFHYITAHSSINCNYKIEKIVIYINEIADEYINNWRLDGRSQCYGNGDSTVLHQAIDSNHFMVSCQKGPTRHAYAWQIGPFWQDTLDFWVASSWQCMSRVCTWFWFELFCCACFMAFIVLIT